MRDTQRGLATATLALGVAGGATGTFAGCGQSLPPPSTAVASSAPARHPNVTNAEQVLATARSKARECYQQGLTVDPTQQGRASFSIAIGADGHVIKAEASPEGTLSTGVTRCIQQALLTLVFNPPEGGSASVTGSFNLKLGKPPESAQ